MVDVAVIGGEDGLVSEETAEDGDTSIQKWNRKCNKGRSHAQDSGGFLAPEDAVAAQEEADQEAAGIAKENRGRIEVEAQNAQESSSERNSGNGQSNVVSEESGYQRGQGCEETYACC